MAKASRGIHDEFEDDDEVNHAGKSEGQGQGREKNRSKHSETEQRRRSKINERFQKLREIIPENDQKRDKASFLLEVIEYIQYLHEKLNMYEGPYQGWNPEPTKLTPWKSTQRPGQGFADPSQVMNNGSGQEHNVVSPTMLTNAQNSVESDLDSAAVYKALDHIRGLATPSIPNMNQQTIFDPIESIGTPTPPMQESNTNTENMASQSQYQLWPGITSTTVTDSKLNRQDGNTTASISSAYSQGVLNNLTLSLQSSGVDLSQASINVELDVGNRAGSGLKPMASSSQAHFRQSLNNQMMTHSQVSSYNENFERAHKRFRAGES